MSLVDSAGRTILDYDEVASENRGLVEAVIVLEAYHNEVCENRDDFMKVIKRIRERLDWTAHFLKKAGRLDSDVDVNAIITEKVDEAKGLLGDDAKDLPPVSPVVKIESKEA